MDARPESSETLRNKCAACFRQYNKMEHLVEHMRVSYHSVHEPKCGVCDKHCRSFESLREHLIGPLPKAECARIFSVQGCNLCLTIFDSSNTLRSHRTACQFSRSMPPGRRDPRVVALACKMVGGGSDGSLDQCVRVCLIDEDENIIFHAYIKPQIPVTNYRGMRRLVRGEHLRDAMPLKHAQRKIQDFLCNDEAIWKIRSKAGKASILVGHGLDHNLDCLGIDYPSLLIRDTTKYPPLMKTSKLSNSLKYLTSVYLGYDMQTGVQDPYEDCVAAMRLYMRMRSQVHPDHPQTYGEAHNKNAYAAWKQRELERASPEALLEISASDYYCWCLDS
ncbi:hypothetical protein QJS10_CPA01g01321 [Acorus calamus]|uniref:RNA exonuclease 4 n=1 Tax=Acorus calamus TaxID=4465 RepID=A0AAV9FXK2_ACOCL|nr:hypothetical protein QJS10_CPA01g01321 [Acorus calamus]